MRDLRVAAVQFEPRDNEPEHNLATMAALARRAAEQGAEVVCFHECCVGGYSWLQPLNREQLLAAAEPAPDGPSCQRLLELSRELGVALLAGLLERDADHRVYNTCVAVDDGRLLARHRKLHTFINPHLTPGDSYTVFDLRGCRAGILICYDNNLPENVRITALLGAEVIFMPHVTGGLPSTMPGRGVIDRQLWERRERDPVRLRQEFEGPKGRGWLLRWLPARAWENGVYAVFANAVGWDYDTVKPGCAMILDPFGEVLAQNQRLDDDVVVALLTPEKLSQASGIRYRLARRPALYGRLVEPQESVTLPGWRMEHETAERDAATASLTSESSAPRSCK